KKFVDRYLAIERLRFLSDNAVCKELVKLDGIGVWTAEMLLIFSMRRPNILSFGDLAILRGMRMVYHHRQISKKLFEKYKKRLSPYASVASLYFWAVAGGAVLEMKDYATKKRSLKR
ncbi:MAG: DNA-3-methyladenine glycosylase 2 family protein, partial [Turicimonas muris]